MYIFLILGCILMAAGGWMMWKGRKLEQQTVAEIQVKYKDELAKELAEFTDACNKTEKALRERVEVAKQRAAEAQEHTDTLVAAEQQRLAVELQHRKELEEVKIQQEHEKQIEQLRLLYQREDGELHAQYVLKQAKYQRDIDQLKAELNEWKNKQDAINQEIQRQQELEDTVNFHRIQLKESDKSDIHFLLSIEDNINNKELLHKLIWTEYIQRPFNQMINSVFGSKIPKNVIYCIEDINTHKKYIGKTSAEVSKRWTDHIKNSLNIGTIKRQNIHDALYNHWDEFTFTILEEVKDDKLGDREKFYINFFQTDKYGFNIKSGG